jgi:DNA polymerase III subunit beta
MRFTVSQKTFLAQIQKLSPVVPSKSTHPILNNILFRLTDNRLELTATDLEMSLTSVIEVEGEEAGEVAIPAKRLLDIVRELEELPITVQSDRNGQVDILSGHGKFHIPGESADNFPVLPDVQVETEITLPAARLRHHIERLSFAVSTDELRPVLTGVLMEFTDEALTLVATDGHRLVRIRDLSLTGQGSLGSVVVPVKALGLMTRVLDDEDVSLGIAQSHMVFKQGDLRIYTRLIEGKYPPYEGVIPDKNENHLQVTRSSVYRAVKQVSNCANSITRQINFKLQTDKIVVTAEDNEYGSRARNEIDVDYSGEGMEIAFNATYIDQMLRHVGTENVVFKFGTADRAALVLPEINGENEDFLMLLMPVRLLRS